MEELAYEKNAVGRFLWRYFLFGAARAIEHELRDDLFRHLETLDPPRYCFLCRLIYCQINRNCSMCPPSNTPIRILYLILPIFEMHLKQSLLQSEIRLKWSLPLVQQPQTVLRQRNHKLNPQLMNHRLRQILRQRNHNPNLRQRRKR